MAILASNECVYFFNLEKRCLTGTQLFNKRHHGATRVLFNPVMNNILVVFGGPNGLIVYNLTDTHHFLREEMSKKKTRSHQIVIKKDACTYTEATFSNNGRYLAMIKDQEGIEILDFHRETADLISQPITFNIGITSLYGSPVYLKFSPSDTYLAISYRPTVKPDKDYDSLLKIFDFTT